MEMGPANTQADQRFRGLSADIYSYYQLLSISVLRTAMAKCSDFGSFQFHEVHYVICYMRKRQNNTIRRVQANQKGLKINGTHWLLPYADDVNILGGSIHTVRKNKEALVIASKLV